MVGLGRLVDVLPAVHRLQPRHLAVAAVRPEGIERHVVRRPPRGVPKSEFASQNWYDVWFPNLAPSLPTMKMAQAARTPAEWARFIRKYRSEMATPENDHALELLAALSHRTRFSIGCYCEDASHCHRSELRKLLVEKGAVIQP